jgi:hypothetical protein
VFAVCTWKFLFGIAVRESRAHYGLSSETCRAGLNGGFCFGSNSFCFPALGAPFNTKYHLSTECGELCGNHVSYADAQQPFECLQRRAMPGLEVKLVHDALAYVSQLINF